MLSACSALVVSIFTAALCGSSEPWVKLPLTAAVIVLAAIVILLYGVMRRLYRWAVKDLDG